MAITIAKSVKKKKEDPRVRKKEDSVSAILQFLSEDGEVPSKKKKEEEEDDELAFLFQELQ